MRTPATTCRRLPLGCANLILLLSCLWSGADAFFTPQSQLPLMRHSTFGARVQQINFIPFKAEKGMVLFAEGEQGPAPKPQERKARPLPPPTPLSSNMREKLLREARSQGADPDASSGNPIAIIALIIGVLVILGGKGFFF